MKFRIGTRSSASHCLTVSLLWILAVACGAASEAAAGPNVGGVLLVHDTGLAFSTDTPGPPYGGPVPADCDGVDIEAPFGSGDQQRIWKVYAAFPAGNSPRLQALSWGVDITPQAGGYLKIAGGAMPTGAIDFAQDEDGFPTANHGWVGQAFPVTGTRTGPMTEVYWFYGYAYGGPGGTDVQYFCLEPPSGGQAATFVDDASPPQKDDIVAYGCLGFGGPGHSHCPVQTSPTGACCDPATGACATLTQAACAGTWSGDGSCEPNTCPQPSAGACCDPQGACTLTAQAACAWTWTEGGSCDPNTCQPSPTGACCALAATCTTTTQAACTGTWTQGGTCDPNTCPPPPTGSCCTLQRTCSITTQADCTGIWTQAGVCTPSPCAWDSALIPGGTFVMGSPLGEPGHSANESQHQVILTKPIYLAKHEVTQAEWQAVMGWNHSPSPGPDKPATALAWYDAVTYCNQRSALDGYTPVYAITNATYDSDNRILNATVAWNQAADGYRLPTEAEWEHACRAGSTTAFCSGNPTVSVYACSPLDTNLDLVAWYCGNAPNSAHDVGGKAANAWGLADMHGNAMEWCWDWYGLYGGTATDPVGPPSGSSRVIRGGGWTATGESCRSADRTAGSPDWRSFDLGARLVRTAFLVREAFLGACCRENGACALAVEAECPGPGIWHADLTSCEPDPCVTTPVLLESWTASSLAEGLRIRWEMPLGTTGGRFRAWRDPAAGPQDAAPSPEAVLVSSAWIGASPEGIVETVDRAAPRGVAVRYFLEITTSGARSEFAGPVEARWDPPKLTWSVGPTPFRNTAQLAPPAAGPARAEIFDPAGRLVRTLVRTDGMAPLPWDGRDDSGREVLAGVYLARLQSGSGSETARLVKIQ
jgi:formylglycine-generating enzyme required for sulfatase activity